MAHPSTSTQRKRLRLESPDDEKDEKPFIDHSTLYFDDGNVILGAGRTLFCVHRSLLAKHSVVLRDLFDHSKEQFRGVLYVRMEETAEEVEALLNMVYDGLHVGVQDLTVETFPTLATVLRMATKYKINRPCADILARIRAEWPATLAQHDAKQIESRARLSKLYGLGDASQRDADQHDGGDQGQHAAAAASAEEDIIVHPASVIALLRQCGYNDHDLLFPLFYALSRTTWQFGGAAVGHHLAPLSSADTERLIVGIERLRSVHFSFAANVPDCPPAPTNPPHLCLPAATELWSGIRLMLLRNVGNRAHEPLEEWREVLPLVHGQYGQIHMCQYCERSLATRIELFRQSLWAALPGYFALS